MKTIIICSGGVDSVAMAGMFKKDELTLMTFNYGQKGIKETEIVKELAKKLAADFKMVDISFVKDLYGDSNQLTSDNVEVKDSYTTSVVVPLRNALFLQVAMVYGYSIGADQVLLGSHIDDSKEVDGERLYPDCSYEFFKTFELAMDMGTFKKDKKVKIVTPSTLGIGKKDLIKKGCETLGDFIFKTWSCYKSEDKQCGVCESCQNRKDAFKKASIEDKTDYEK